MKELIEKINAEFEAFTTEANQQAEKETRQLVQELVKQLWNLANCSKNSEKFL